MYKKLEVGSFFKAYFQNWWTDGRYSMVQWRVVRYKQYVNASMFYTDEWQGFAKVSFEYPSACIYRCVSGMRGPNMHADNRVRSELRIKRDVSTSCRIYMSKRFIFEMRKKKEKNENKNFSLCVLFIRMPVWIRVRWVALHAG